MQWGDSDTSTDAYDCAELLNVRWCTQWANQVGDFVAFVQLRQAVSGAADGLEDERNLAFVGVRVGDGEGDALSIIAVQLENDELTRFSLFCDQGCFDPHQEDFVRKLLLV